MNACWLSLPAGLVILRSNAARNHSCDNDLDADDRGYFCSAAAGRPFEKGDKPESTNLKKERQKVPDRAYRSAVRKIPEPEKNFDPWGDVRF